MTVMAKEKRPKSLCPRALTMTRVERNPTPALATFPAKTKAVARTEGSIQREPICLKPAFENR
jgi:hypothetical protein